MKKTFILMMITTLLILISCEVIEESNDNNTNDANNLYNNNEIIQEESHKLTHNPSFPIMKDGKSIEDDKFDSPKMNDSDNSDSDKLSDHDNKDKKLTTHYDTKALDDRVRARAKELNVDPNTFRLPIAYDHNSGRGAEVYRMIGMHVIVNPDGSEVYLPDEI
jgi:hypothetical protein